MSKVYPIHEAKTQLSKLVKMAEAGQVIYLGAYGKPEVIITRAPEKKPITIGVYAYKKIPDAYEYSDLVGSDSDVTRDFEESINRPLS